MSKPTLVLCHGAWHDTTYFDKVVAILEPQGYKCVTVPMPGTGSCPPVKSLDEDISAVRTAVLKELDAGNNVLVNAHSWAGIPVSSALDGLSIAEREKEGKITAVTKLAFIASFVLEEGVSLEDATGGDSSEWKITPEGNVVLEDFSAAFYHDCDQDEAALWVSRLRGQSLVTFLEKARSAAWRRIPSTYLVCEDDKAIPAFLQDSWIAKVKEQGGDMQTERLLSAHSPYISQPDFVARFLRRSAGEDVPESS